MVTTAYRAARDVLWSAPCDLTLAARLVEEYQHAVRVGTGAAPAGAPAEERQSRRRPVVSAQHCEEPGCTGEIEDGYCNVCGTPARAAGPASTPSSTSSGSAPLRPSISTKLASTPIGSARAGLSRPTRRLVTASSRVQHLGAGITNVPAAPIADPRSIVLANPSVPEEKRFCSACGAPVGRGRDGAAGRTEGFCPKCRTPYSFAPKLHAGDLVGGQYAVVGCIAHGGLGWIYLARDRNVSDRYVVLKGLLNTGDQDAFEAAVAERRFLAEVQHPLILEIYNFASFDGAGYIVMEYVGGRSLKQILKDRMAANDGRYDPIPADQAIAYVIEILPAFSYLHSQGLLYCDFKPDNVIQAGDTIKLIDLGGVRRVDDDQSAIYGTAGYQAPEVAEVGPTVASDIFTIGRTLAVLAMEFRGYQSTYAATLPPIEDVPLFQRYDSLYRVLAKATATNPGRPVPVGRRAQGPTSRGAARGRRRRQRRGRGRPFEPVDAVRRADRRRCRSRPGPISRRSASTAPIRRRRGSPASRSATAPSACGSSSRRPWRASRCNWRRCVPRSTPVRSRVADQVVNDMLNDNPWEWRAVWLSGLAALARGDFETAATACNTTLGQVPGELAPKLALALACEKTDAQDLAEQLYAVCAATDANYVAPAAFGLARTRAARGDLTASLQALDLVERTSGAYTAARRRRADLLTASTPGLPALSAAAASIEDVAIDPRDRLNLTVRILTAAITEVARVGDQPLTTIGDVPAADTELRVAAEAAYRDLATLTSDRQTRIQLVDAANAVRPRTLV